MLRRRRGARRAAGRREGGVARSTDWRATVRRDNVDVVFVATTNDQLAPIAAEAAAAGKHVLIEKPGARAADGTRRVADAARAHRRAGPRRLQSPLSPRVPQGARDRRDRRARAS